MRGNMLVDLRLQLALGRAIRTRRKALGLTQVQLAVPCGTDRANIARVESGRHGICIGTLCLVARGLRCEASEVLRDAEQLVAAERREEAAE